MKAIFIDAEHRKIEEIEIGFSGRCGLGEFYEKIGNGCSYVQALPWDDENDLIVDEEVVLHGNVHFGFRYGDAGTRILGNAIIVGIGDEDWADTTAIVEEVSGFVGFFEIINNHYEERWPN